MFFKIKFKSPCEFIPEKFYIAALSIDINPRLVTYSKFYASILIKIFVVDIY